MKQQLARLSQCNRNHIWFITHSSEGTECRASISNIPTATHCLLFRKFALVFVAPEVRELAIFLTNFDAERLGNHAVDHVEKLSNILLLQWHLLLKGTYAIQSRASIKSCRLHGSHIYLCCEHHEHIHYLKVHVYVAVVLLSNVACCCSLCW
ncbi:uncharacterized protein LOC124314279 [Daphnia pulicaria]|uniref:uncharacterized protein LOC124314279 n=1 Tax=Daphnia pulicaria TaxID=35523 RepID=UPI001EEA3FD3|nr:uncharacterized protein LOC124314279 [Daphnia pulicaria]XP_046635401.1 uncharacterized protein LOC124314279 [Daphnia pulicaria]